MLTIVLSALVAALFLANVLIARASPGLRGAYRPSQRSPIAVVVVVVLAAGDVALLVWGRAPVSVTSLIATLGLYILWTGSIPAVRQRRR